MHKYILAISTFFLSVSAFGTADTFVVNIGDSSFVGDANTMGDTSVTGSANVTGDSLALAMAHEACGGGSASHAAADHANGDHPNGDKRVNGDKRTNGDKRSYGDVLCASEMNSLSILSGQGRQGDYVCQCM
jgi:hypothetical protein